MKNFNISSTLINKDAVWSTIWSVVQQLVVAASTYFIVKAIQFVTSGDLQTGLQYILAFTASLILVYLPNTLSMAYLQRWRLTSIENFVRAFIEKNRGKTSFGHTRNKVKIESWLTNESFTVFENATGLLYQIFSTLMNSVFNILIIAIAIDSRILGWYILAGIILVGANRLSRGQVSKASLAVQDSRKNLSSSMLSAWQNIFVGNRHNFDNWNLSYTERMKVARDSATAYDITRSLISSATVSVALIVVAFGNGMYVIENQQNIPAIAALFITLPRQLQIIQSIFAFFNLMLSWAGTHDQLKALASVVQSSETPADSIQYIKFQAIDIYNGVNGAPVPDLNSFTEKIESAPNGRWTLRGPNGAGKSTLLSLLKEHTAEQSFLLPTNYEDLCFNGDFLNHSDGNRLLTVFEKIAELKDIKFIILDEWDANLDGRNLQLVNQAIEKLALSKVIIESRHRV